MGFITENAVDSLLDQQKSGDDWLEIVTIIAELFEEIIAANVALSTQTWKDTAEGVWLDRVGEIVGVSRPPEEEVDNLFTVCDVGEPGWEDVDLLHGWGTTANPSSGGILYDLDGVMLGTSAIDGDYLDFINAKIAATNADASVPGLARYALNAFGIAAVITATPGKVVITLPTTGYDMRQRRYLEMFCPAMAGIDVVFEGYPEV